MSQSRRAECCEAAGLRYVSAAGRPRQKVDEPASASLPVLPAGRIVRPFWFLAAALLLATGGLAGWLAHRPSEAAANPLASATFTRLTDFAGVERDAAISPDGRFVAFLSNRGGPLDICVSQVGTGNAVNLNQGKTGNLDGLVTHHGLFLGWFADLVP